MDGLCTLTHRRDGVTLVPWSLRTVHEQKAEKNMLETVVVVLLVLWVLGLVSSYTMGGLIHILLVVAVVVLLLRVIQGRRL